MALHLLPCAAPISRPPPLAAVARTPGRSRSGRELLRSPRPGPGARGRPRCGRTPGAPRLCARAAAAAPPSPPSPVKRSGGEAATDGHAAVSSPNTLSPGPIPIPLRLRETPAAAGAASPGFFLTFASSPSLPFGKLRGGGGGRVTSRLRQHLTLPPLTQAGRAAPARNCRGESAGRRAQPSASLLPPHPHPRLGSPVPKDGPLA